MILPGNWKVMAITVKVIIGFMDYDGYKMATTIHYRKNIGDVNMIPGESVTDS